MTGPLFLWPTSDVVDEMTHDPTLAKTVGKSVSRHYTLNNDLALWVRDEAVRRQWTPDIVVRYAVAEMQAKYTVDPYAGD